ncbi:MAG: hypothetical protein ABIP65_03435 [Vicinamibacterales bacterium]
MKLARTGLIAAAILAVSSVAFAQKPDFSGTWTPDAPAAMAPPATVPAPPAGGGPGGGGGRGGMMGPMTVKQSADSLTIERAMGENKMMATYKLDGTESINKQMGRGGEIEVKSVAKWDGSKLVITTKQAAPDGTVRESSQTWSLEAGALTVENARTGRDGSPMVTKTVYKKTT